MSITVISQEFVAKAALNLDKSKNYQIFNSSQSWIIFNIYLI